MTVGQCPFSTYPLNGLQGTILAGDAAFPGPRESTGDRGKGSLKELWFSQKKLLFRNAIPRIFPDGVETKTPPTLKGTNVLEC